MPCHITVYYSMTYFLGPIHCVCSSITAHNLTPAKLDELILGNVHLTVALTHLVMGHEISTL